MGIIERKERDRNKRISDIIDAAEKLFFLKNTEKTTMDDIAKEAELSKGTLYLYFKNKEDLHYAVILRGMEEMTKLFKKFTSKANSGLENLLQIGKAYIQFSVQYANYFKIMMDFHAGKFEKIDESKKNKLLDKNSPLIFVGEMIKQGQEDGSVRNDISTEQLAIILWSQLNGVLEFITLRKKLLEVFNIPEHEISENQFKILLNGISTKNE